MYVAGTDRSACMIVGRTKHCFTLRVCDDEHFVTRPPLPSSETKKKDKKIELTDAPGGDRSRKRDYIIRERGRRKGLERKNILHRSSVYLILIM